MPQAATQQVTSFNLQLNSYKIFGVSVAPSPDFKPKQLEYTGEVSTGIRTGTHRQDSNKHKVTLDVRIEPKKGKEDACFPYIVAIRGDAYFTTKDISDGAMIEKALHLQGTSILYGLLRAQVAQITAQGIYGTYLMPTLNFVSMYENMVRKRGQQEGKQILPASGKALPALSGEKPKSSVGPTHKSRAAKTGRNSIPD